MKHLLSFPATLFSIVMLGSCTNFNLVEQIDPPDMRIPVAIPPADERYVYEWQGAYYIPITVAMAKEDMPLLTSGLHHAGAIYCDYPRYTPDAATARVYMFRLRAHEISGYIEEAPNESASSDNTPNVIAAKDFPYAHAKRHRLTHGSYHHNILKPASTGWVKAHRGWIFDKDAPYPVDILPMEPGTRSWADWLAYGPLAVLDAAGNIVIKGTEVSIAMTTGAVIMIPVGILYLCGERLP